MKLSAEYIRNNWDAIEYAITEALPPTSTIEYEGMMVEIQKALFSEAAECWILFSNDTPHLLMVDYYSIDFFTKEKTMVIYAMYGYKFIPDPLWFKMFEVIKKRAKDEGCLKIQAVSASERVNTIVNMLGWNTEYRLLTSEV